MSQIKTAKKSEPPASPLSPEDQGHPVVEVYEGIVDGRPVATVSLTLDAQTWIAGMIESDSNSHIGSFSSLDEAKNAVTERLTPTEGPISWVRKGIH